ncbi:SDR family oxidoreductase [Nocardioides alcanivorans]|uniref:SDR family oxidoreductase n=1 Tax=Nocardioides alcanivorans TaxID=2897352 RepID=UPI001F459EEE|nr:SDR family oxidoreductase [Nocardioides alcanivorans]
MSVVVTGATGHLGNLVVRSLIARGTEPASIVATGRSADRLTELAALGVQTAAFDFNAPAEGVIKQGDTVLLVSGSEVGQRVPQHTNVIEAATKAGAARVVYTSAPKAHDTTLVLAPEHIATESVLRESGLPFTILRNGWYHENYQQNFEQAAQTGSLLSSAGDGRVSSASRADLADAAAVVLTSEGHEGAVYELGGDEALSMADQAAVFADVLGKPVEVNNVSTEEHVAALVGVGLDEGTAGFVAALDKNTADGELVVDSGDLARLIGRPTQTFADAVRSWAV